MPQDNQQAVWDQAYAYRKNNKAYTRLVTEGDSWFCYPMWRSMMDVIAESNRFAICRRGESGRRLLEIVNDGRYLTAVRSEKPEALLISGSGNDFVNKEFVTGLDGQPPLFNKYTNGMGVDALINEDKWTNKINDLYGYFDTIVQNVGGLPVVTHGYDYIVPSGKPAAYDGLHVAGPWIKPTMDDQGIPEELQQGIVVLLIDSLNDMMRNVATTHSTFIHVDIRGTCVAADWANEIHPYESGFEKLAAKCLKGVDAVLAHPPVVADAGGGS